MNMHINKKPKFKVGDWIIYSEEEVHLITGFDDNGYFVNKKWYIPFNCEGNMRLWTIKDAKEGDVLTYVTDEEDLWIMIYWSLYEPYEGHVHYHALLVNDNFYGKGTCCICINDLKPATKDQHNLLFQKMKEEGYEWDADKKESNKIGQKPTDKAEPKFHEGDWVVHNVANFVFQIVGIGTCGYNVVNREGYAKTISLSNEENYHLWTIQDAKDGDVLYSREHNLLFLYYTKEQYHIAINLNYSDNNISVGTDIVIPKDTCPATKDQHNLLFQKMKEAGYEWNWNTKKKELKKIEQKQVIDDYPDSLPKDNWELVHEFVEKFGRIPEDEDELNVLVEYVLKRQKFAWSNGNKKLTDVNHEYFSELLENDDSTDINYYAYQVAYCMSHDWVKDNATWEDIQQACKLGALWQQKQDQHKLKKRTEEEFKSLFKKHYENGRKSMKGELLKHYISSDVFDDGKQLYTTETWDDMDALLKSINAKSGDKVKIIIVKE